MATPKGGQLAGSFESLRKQSSTALLELHQVTLRAGALDLVLKEATDVDLSDPETIGIFVNRTLDILYEWRDPKLAEVWFPLSVVFELYEFATGGMTIPHQTHIQSYVTHQFFASGWITFPADKEAQAAYLSSISTGSFSRTSGSGAGTGGARAGAGGGSGAGAGAGGGGGADQGTNKAAKGSGRDPHKPAPKYSFFKRVRNKFGGKPK